MSDDVKRYMICGGGAHESPRGTWVTAYDYDRLRADLDHYMKSDEMEAKECDRLRAEIKKKDRALLAAKYDAERVEYYRNTLCVDNGKWDCLPKTGAAASVIDPEKLGNVLDERDRLRAELAEKDKRIAELEVALDYALPQISREQINAAWERGKKQPDQNVNGYYEGLWSLGIVSCDECGGCATPDCVCNGRGWVMEE